MTDPAGRGAAAVMLVCDYSLRYLGGAQTAFVRQARSLADQGWTVVVVAPDADVLAGTANVIPVSPHVRWTLPGLDLPILGRRDGLAATLGELIDRHGVAAMVVHSEFALAAAVLAVGARRAVPVLHTVHTFFWRAPVLLSPLAPVVRWFHRRLTGLPSAPRYTGSTPIDNALRGMTLRVALRADVVLSPSAHQAQALRDAGVAQARAFSNVAEPMQLTDPPAAGPLTLLWAARFAPEKRVDVALDAIRIVGERLGPGRVHLHVAGGTRKPQPDVTFHGAVSADRVAALIADSHAVLITSLGFDNQPMIALEAFTRGRPVLVSDPALATEFGAAALGTVTPDAAGLAEVLIAAIADDATLRAAGAGAVAYAQARQSAEHAAALKRAITDAAARASARPKLPSHSSRGFTPIPPTP
ncbi:glycosyltransferase family 4 protein [Microbacterium kribbense]